jgi:hypothetical protein
MEQMKAQAQAQNDARDSQNRMQEMVMREQMLDKRNRDQFAEQHAWEREKFYAQQAANLQEAAMKAGVDAQTAGVGANVVLHDLNSGTTTQIPTDTALQMRSQNLDAANQEADRQHDATQQEATRQNQADMQQEQLKSEEKRAKQKPPPNKGGNKQ